MNDAAKSVLECAHPEDAIYLLLATEKTRNLPDGSLLIPPDAFEGVLNKIRHWGPDNGVSFSTKSTFRNKNGYVLIFAS